MGQACAVQKHEDPSLLHELRSLGLRFRVKGFGFRFPVQGLRFAGLEGESCTLNPKPSRVAVTSGMSQAAKAYKQVGACM